MLLLRITLEDVEPAVWREIAVPEEFDFWALHCAIQDAMGWKDCHLHEFHVRGIGGPGVLRIGVPDPDGAGLGPPVQAGWNLPIAPYLPRVGSAVKYLYDFGDGWSHVVELRERRPAAARERLPRCVAGARACPPEDCGGPPGYADFLAAIRDPRDERHEELLEWVGGVFEPEVFKVGKVRFRDAGEYWRELFGPPRRLKGVAKGAKKGKGRGKGSR